MSAPALPPTSRKRETLAGEEEAGAELKLGEFTGVPTLSLSEARLLINAVIEHRKQTNRKFVETESVLEPFLPFAATSTSQTMRLAHTGSIISLTDSCRRL